MVKQRVFVLRTHKIIHVVARYIASIWTPDGVLYEVIIRPFKDTRSKQQNRYYWVVLKMIGDHFGYTDNEMHEHYKSEFLKLDDREILGKETKFYKSTTKLSKVEFSEYMERIGRECAEFDFVVPPPLAIGYEL